MASLDDTIMLCKFGTAGGAVFYCPGCREIHQVKIEGEGAWTWNGDRKKPTFHPSLLIRTGHYVPGHESPPCWCTYNEEHVDSPAPFECGICHSFIVDGRIQYLADCTHELVGKTVEIPKWDEVPNAR